MAKFITFSLCAILLIFTACAGRPPRARLAREDPLAALRRPSDPLLWYSKPAADWNEALPVGNGTLGAMVFGGVEEETIQINDHELWAGGPKDRVNPKGLAALPEIRKLIFEGRTEEATKLAESTLMGIPPTIESYEPLCDLILRMPNEGKIYDYRRELNLATGVATTTWRRADGVRIERNIFISNADGVLVVRIRAFGKSPVIAHPEIKRAFGDSGENCAYFNCPEMDGFFYLYTDRTSGDQGMQFCVGMAIEEGSIANCSLGSVQGLTAMGEHELILRIASATSLKNAEPESVARQRLRLSQKKSYDELLAAHITDHRALFDRVSLQLGERDNSLKRIPTDERLERYKNGKADPALESLLFQYGRYLLIGSSRPGGLPANLQGLWSKDMKAPWNADYHLNINLQMNYWPAESCNLAELHEPLFDFMDQLKPHGEDVARRLYGARGWVAHHLTDVYGFAVPADGIWGVWPMGAAWLARHPWEHYLYSRNEQFLRNRAWPLMKGAAEFMLDFLVEAPSGSPVAGKLVTNPSHSPENAFKLENGATGSFTYGATMDLEILYDLFTNTIEASKILNIEPELRGRLEAALARLAPLQISKKTGAL